jgi:hypothetical protein|tara:strand:- start:93 stop:311 length:219 start_codon:yes stop_codon:yes gene_type:complete
MADMMDIDTNETKSDQRITPEQILLDARSELANAEALADSDPEASLAAFDALLINDGRSHGFLFYDYFQNQY